MNLSDKTALIYERGVWVPFAQAIAGPDGFGRVLYHSTNACFSTKSNEALIGRGFDGIERVDSFWEFVDEADVICFPQVGDGDIAHWLKRNGYAVWGPCKGEMLELDRWQTRQLIAELGMPTPDTTRVLGIDALRNELKDREDCYLKTSWFRADFETHHFINYEIDKPWIDELEFKLGPHAREIEVLIEEPVKGLEPGYDGYFVNGQFPKTACWGYEQKDKGFLGKAQAFDEMPDALRDTCNGLIRPLKELGLNGNFHSEIRIDDEGKAHIIDLTCRAGSPPFETMMRMITNWADIVYAGAHGELVEPDVIAPYGCQIILKSMWVLDKFLRITIPDELEPFLSLRRGTKIDEEIWAVPSPELELIGSVVGVGKTPETAIAMAKEVAESVEALELEFASDCEDELMKLVKEGEKVLGQEF